MCLLQVWWNNSWRLGLWLQMLLPPQKCELSATERFHLCLWIIYFVCGFSVIFQRPDCLADLLSGNRLCPACCPYPNFLGRILSLILTITLHRVSHEMPKKKHSQFEPELAGHSGAPFLSEPFKRVEKRHSQAGFDLSSLFSTIIDCQLFSVNFRHYPE